MWLAASGKDLDKNYGAALIEYGYDSMDAIKAGTEDDLVEAMGELELNGDKVKVKKPHQHMIIKAYNALE